VRIVFRIVTIRHIRHTYLKKSPKPHLFSLRVHTLIFSCYQRASPLKHSSLSSSIHPKSSSTPYFTDFLLGPSPDPGSRDWIGTQAVNGQALGPNPPRLRTWGGVGWSRIPKSMPKPSPALRQLGLGRVPGLPLKKGFFGLSIIL
jgi:hypothetical protein